MVSLRIGRGASSSPAIRPLPGSWRDVVGLYVNPPAHALVLSIDEKSQTLALDRTQPGLPLKKGRGAIMTHDYKRNGTTTLFAALDVLTGEAFGRNMRRHRHQEFIRFLNALKRATFRQASWSTSSSTTTPPTNMKRCPSGSIDTRAGRSTEQAPIAPPFPQHLDPCLNEQNLRRAISAR